MDQANRQAMIEALDGEHASMAEILAQRPRCLLRTRGETPQQPCCAYREQCGGAIRKTLSALLFASIAHFDNEREALRATVCREDFESHGNEHIRLTETLTEILGTYTDSGDCLRAIGEIDGFMVSVRSHMAATDTRMLRTRPPGDDAPQ